jgi:hypothetical protein
MYRVIVYHIFGDNIDGLVKSPSTRRARVSAGREWGVEPFEFISNGGGGEALPRRVKRRFPTFYEIINIEFSKYLFVSWFYFAANAKITDPWDVGPMDWIAICRLFPSPKT